MFRGDHPDLRRVMHGSLAMARDLDHPRAGSEHLLLALSAAGGAVAAVLDQHGATEAAVLEAVRQAAPLGAGAAADRDTLAPLGIDVDRMLSRLSRAALDRPIAPEPLLPFGAAKARRRCARPEPATRSGRPGGLRSVAPARPGPGRARTPVRTPRAHPRRARSRRRLGTHRRRRRHASPPRQSCERLPAAQAQPALTYRTPDQPAIAPPRPGPALPAHDWAHRYLRRRSRHAHLRLTPRRGATATAHRLSDVRGRRRLMATDLNERARRLRNAVEPVAAGVYSDPVHAES